MNARPRIFLSLGLLAVFSLSGTAPAVADTIGTPGPAFVYVSDHTPPGSIYTAGPILDYTATYVYGQFSSNWPQYGINLFSKGSANLSTGELRAYISSGGSGGGGASFTSGYGDRIYLDGSGDGGSIAIVAHLQGSYTAPYYSTAAGGYLGGFVWSTMGVSNVRNENGVNYQASAGNAYYPHNAAPQSYTLSIPVSAGLSYLDFYSYLQVSVSGNGVSDFFNTVTYDIYAPEGVEVYTEYMKFTNLEPGLPSPAVPVPATMLLLVSGLVGLAQIMGRRHN